MNFDSTLEAIKKHGALGAVILWLVVTNGRLNKVEELLFECYQARAATARQAANQPKHLYAVLPEKPTIKKERKC